MAGHDFRSTGLDGVFSQSGITDAMIDADTRVRAEIGGEFPGWMLYRKIVAGVDIYDGEIEEWAYLSAHALANASQNNGRRYLWPSKIGKAWITAAAWDALDRVVQGAWPVTAEVRAEQYGVSAPTYRKIRNPVAGGIIIGLETYKQALHYHYLRERARERLSVAD